MALVKRYRYAIVNDDLEIAYGQLKAVVQAEKLRTCRCVPDLAET